MATRVISYEHPAIGDLDVAEPQAEDLTAAQPAQQHGFDHRPVRRVRSAPIDESTSSGDRFVGNVRGTRTNGAVRDVTDPA